MMNVVGSDDDAYESFGGAGPEAGADIGPGTLLLASTDLLDPNFGRSVIYVLEHDDSGTLGVILNQHSETPVHNLLPEWSGAAAAPKVVFIGGPVKQDAAVCLGVLKATANDDDSTALRQIHGRVVMVDLDSDPDEVAGLVEGVRVFAGYAGWGVGQLADELAQGSWLVTDGRIRDILAGADVDIWGEAMRRQPWPIPLFASHPIDVMRN